ncbi:MAG: glycosyltransferase family 2 protein [Candidatus Micrarchaeota archaeon]|nr:glycosyltransferase family 2 protein [Candidatus Micrarchaeota archaeon]MCX8154379.1 glycosyltransferase family 2 protein [Candidatus Micrarchaeota archaeon]
MRFSREHVRLFLLGVIFFIILVLILNIAKPVRYFLAIVSFFIVFTISFVFITKLIQKYDLIIRGSGKSYDWRISFVVPVYNERENLRKCIDAILNIDYPKDKYEIVIVDDGSTDITTKKILEEYRNNPHIKIINKQNGGAASAKNVGIHKSTGDIIITIDSDSIIDRDAPARLASYFQDPLVGGVSGSVRVISTGKALNRWQSIEYDIILVYRRILEAFDSVYVTPGGLSAFRKEAIQRVGLFDVNSLTEDQEIAMNLQKHGYKVLASLDAFAYTEVPENLSSLIKQRVRWIRGGIWNRIKHQDLLDLKWGNLFVFGYLLDVLFFIPFSTFFLSLILFLIDHRLWIFRLGLDLLDLIVDHFLVSTFIFWIILLPWQIHMINILRNKANENPVKPLEILDFIGFMILFGWAWFLVWPFVIHKELTQAQNRWETR